MKTKLYNNLKKYDVRRITFKGKYIIQWYDGNQWRNYAKY